MTLISVSALCGHILLVFLCRFQSDFGIPSLLSFKNETLPKCILKCLWRQFIHSWNHYYEIPVMYWVGYNVHLGVFIRLYELFDQPSRNCSKHWKHTRDSDIQGPWWVHCFSTNLFLLNLPFPFTVNPWQCRFLFPFPWHLYMFVTLSVIPIPYPKSHWLVAQLLNDSTWEEFN